MIEFEVEIYGCETIHTAITKAREQGEAELDHKMRERYPDSYDWVTPRFTLTLKSVVFDSDKYDPQTTFTFQLATYDDD
jgi:hypothetical protein